MQHYIVSNPNILDGEPVIVGTRVPVVVILQFLKEEYTFEEIRAMYPHLSIATLKGMLEEVATAVTCQPQFAHKPSRGLHPGLCPFPRI